jgi:polyferredoxin
LRRESRLSPEARQKPGELEAVWVWLLGRTGRKADRSFRARLLVQSGLALTCIVIGIQLSRFYRAAQAGAVPLPHRPPGVEGFLPISGLMGLLDWCYQGTLNRIHPAATILVLLALILAFVLRKSFCSWICPVGLLSESLARLGRRLFGRNFRPWRWLDIPLRGLKYLLLGFFLISILMMSAAELQAFIGSPYNRIADVKMGLFFMRLGVVGASVLGFLAVASIFVNGAWCRYLCPYGALLGFFSGLSPVRIRRDADSCIDCDLCDRVCMARLPVSTSREVRSVECTGCLDCVAVCPVESTLVIQAGRRRLSPAGFAAAVLVLFVGGYLAAQVAGLWSNSISDREYVFRLQSIDRSEYAHPGSDDEVAAAGGSSHGSR